MNFGLLITSSPSHQASYSAYQFCFHALSQGHQIYRVFFYADAANSANQLSTAPQDELDITSLWGKLIEEHNLDAIVCIAAGIKRGIIDQEQATRYEKSAASLDARFELSGLGQLADMSIVCDRIITFGA